jgi:RNA polymerase sigma-70 factor, ECF subfamily
VSNTQHLRLRDLFAADYDELFGRLVRRFGSREFTLEVLHETYLRIDRIDDPSRVNSPRDYFFRAAVNVAKNRRKAESRRASATQIEALLDVPDDTPDPARIVEGRSEIAILKIALAELPPRQRLVLEGIAIGGGSVQDLAKQIKVSTRTVELDLKQALHHCAKRLNRDLPKRLGGPRPKI